MRRIACLIATLMTCTVAAQQPPGGPEQTPAPRAVAEWTPALAAEVQSEIDSWGVPGLALAIVRRDAPPILAGFGRADLENAQPVDPYATRFYVASVTKAFTAAAVVRLVEAEQLNLDADVRQYVPHLSIPNHGFPPLTLCHLLTHTSGLRDRNIGMAATEPAALMPLADYLARRLPDRVRPPGRMMMYDNHGFALAGLIAESAAGRPFAALLKSEVFGPLGMVDASALQPAPDIAGRPLAVGYEPDWTGAAYRHGRAPETPRYTTPAGSVTLTAADAAQFMHMLLRGGHTDDGAFLTPASAELLLRPSFRHHPQQAGLALGFYEEEYPGRRVISVLGGAPGYSARMTLLPDEGIGVFLAANADRLRMLGDIARRIIGPPQAANSVASAPAGPAAARSDPAPLGVFQTLRYADNTFESLAKWDQQLRITAADDDAIVLQTRRGEQIRMRPAAPGLYRQVDGPETLAVLTDAGGRVSGVATAWKVGVPSAFERVAWYDEVHVAQTVLRGCALAFLSAVTVWPLAAGSIWAWRRWRGRPPLDPARPAPPRLARTLAALLSGAQFGLMALVTLLLANPMSVIAGPPSSVSPVFLLPWLSLIGLPAMLWMLGSAVRRRSWTPVGRVYYAVLCAAQVLWIAFCARWSLFNFVL